MASNDTNITSNAKPCKTGSITCLFGFYNKGLLDKDSNILPVKRPDFYKEVELTNEIYNSLASTLLNGQSSALKASTAEILFFVNVQTVFSEPAVEGTDYITAYYHCLTDVNLYSFYDYGQNRIVIAPETSEQRVVVLTAGGNQVDRLQYIPFFAVAY